MIAVKAQKCGSRKRSSVVPCCGGDTSWCAAGNKSTWTEAAFLGDAVPGGEREGSFESKGEVSVDEAEASGREVASSDDLRWDGTPSSLAFREARDAVDDNPGRARAPKRWTMPVTIDSSVKKPVTFSVSSMVKVWSAMTDSSSGEHPKRAMLVPDATPM